MNRSTGKYKPVPAPVPRHLASIHRDYRRESSVLVAYHRKQMTRFGTDYQIGRATGRCAATDVVLEPGSTCVATLCVWVD